MKENLPKILISSCLLGENVKYDGKNNLIKDPILNKLKKIASLIPICPEVMGGLSIPRTPAEQQNQKVIDKNARDVTAEFIKGADISFDLANNNNAIAAILKERSPSCGVHQIYDGTFSKIPINGMGVTTKLLIQNGIKVFNENELRDCIEWLILNRYTQP